MAEEKENDKTSQKKEEGTGPAKKGRRRYRLSTINLLTMAAIAVVGAVFASFVFPSLMNVATPVFAFLGPIGWMGAMAILYAAVEGLGVDLGMGIFRWRDKLAGVMIGAGLGSLMIGEVYIFLFHLQSTYAIIVGGITAFISGAICGGLIGWLIARALYKTGVVSKIGLGYEKID
ncbi:MAG: hypothetical protein AB1798_10960 [Spirochaetota bacterium]